MARRVSEGVCVRGGGEVCVYEGRWRVGVCVRGGGGGGMGTNTNITGTALRTAVDAIKFTVDHAAVLQVRSRVKLSMNNREDVY